MSKLKFGDLHFLFSIKLGVIEDSANRTRLAKLLKFLSSASKDKATSLAEYVERMSEKQEHIYYMAGASQSEASCNIIKS